MYQISEKEWNKVLKRFKNRSTEIKFLEEELVCLEKELDEKERENKELKEELKRINKENMILLSTQKTLLENLNESLNMLENHKIKQYKTINSNSLDEYV